MLFVCGEIGNRVSWFPLDIWVGETRLQGIIVSKDLLFNHHNHIFEVQGDIVILSEEIYAKHNVVVVVFCFHIRNIHVFQFQFLVANDEAYCRDIYGHGGMETVYTSCSNFFGAAKLT